MNGENAKLDSSSGKFLKTVQPLRDLESNWTVDLANNLEEYLLKICSGQISRYEDGIFSVNFAEAALLLQGSVQVYSRKVEYLYSLVLHALDFISQKRLAENEKQTEIATRVSSWKQRIDQNLEEQDAHPPFDIHKYGESVLNKISTGGDAENKTQTFGDVVKGQEKHGVARTFSVLLQSVNNGDVDLLRNNQNATRM